MFLSTSPRLLSPPQSHTLNWTEAINQSNTREGQEDEELLSFLLRTHRERVKNVWHSYKHGLTQKEGEVVRNWREFDRGEDVPGASWVAGAVTRGSSGPDGAADGGKWMHQGVCPTHVFTCIHVCVLLHTYLFRNSFNHLPLLHTAPHLTLPCPAPQGLSQKSMRGVTVFHPCGGQSLWIRQPSLGSFPLGSSAQQALSCHPPPPAFEMSPQTQDSGHVPLFDGRWGPWWLTLSLCLWTCHARAAEL